MFWEIIWWEPLKNTYKVTVYGQKALIVQTTNANGM